ncbi:MAG TPA: hypothetical protein VGV87_24265 [Blastocatellia bacterium]|nr:hypothetical protein [Blastocatellia bacterium]
MRGSSEAHGGKITVESSAALGTTFTIHLPRTPVLIKPRSSQPPDLQREQIFGEICFFASLNESREAKGGLYHTPLPVVVIY